MIAQHQICPLCDYGDIQVQQTGITSWTIRCMGCGEVTFQGFMVPGFGRDGLQLPQAFRQTRQLIASAAAERRVRKEDGITVTPESWEILAANCPQTFPEQMDRFLTNLAAASSEPGMMTSLSSAKDAPLAYAAAKDSLIFRLETLRDMGFIQFQGKREDKLNDLGFRLTYSGWQRVRETERGGKSREQVFIAMTLNPRRMESDDAELVAVKEALVGAVADAGYRPMFMGDLVHGDRIDDRILVELQRSRLVLVDTTGHNANVVFEAGYALGLGRTVLWTCKDGDHQNQGFDIRQYRRILWQAGQEARLQAEVAAAIELVSGRGPIQSGGLA